MADLETIRWWKNERNELLRSAPSVSKDVLKNLQKEGRKRGIREEKLSAIERQWNKRKGGSAVKTVERIETEPVPEVQPVVTAEPKSTTKRPSQK